MYKRIEGITLIELLIAAAISLVILALVFQGITGGSSSTRVIQGQYQVTEELRNAGGYIADTIAQAAYIYPPGVSITLGSSSLNTYTVTRPPGGTGNPTTWVVGTDPIFAALLPPRVNSTASCSSTNPDRCLSFVAFYALQRSNVVANAPVNANPGADTNDVNTWMIAKYECIIDGSSGGACGGSAQSYVPDTVPNSFSGSYGQMVADYISPTNWSVSYRCAKDSHGDVTMNSDCGTASLDKNSSAARVSLSMSSSVLRQGKSISTGALTFQMAGRNLVF
jgi:type II secretory pathway pseudopilin PulG